MVCPSSRVISHANAQLDGDLGPTIAAGALRDPAIHGHSSVLEPLNILLGGRRPSLFCSFALGVRTQMETNFVRLVKLPLKIDIRVGFGKLIFRGDEVSIEAIETE